MSDDSEFDQQARRMAKIMGASLGAQIANEEYRSTRGADNAEALALLRRAEEIREQETTK